MTPSPGPLDGPPPLELAIGEFVINPETVRIDGQWRGQPCIYYTNYDTKVAVICRPDGDLWQIYKLSRKQHYRLWHEGRIAGLP
jgi:hypothetical protein